MRPWSVVLLFRLFWLFIVRRVLGRGLLASPAARLAAPFLVLAAFAGFNVLSYAVIRQYLGESGLLELVLRVANASVGFWVLIAYTLIRVLFMKADELLKISFNLPVTNKERTLAFSLFESSIVLLMTLFVFGAFSISTVLIEGPDYIQRVLASIWFPAISTYLILSLGYYLLERVLLALRIARLRGLVVPLVLASRTLGSLPSNQRAGLPDRRKLLLRARLLCTGLALCKAAGRHRVLAFQFGTACNISRDDSSSSGGGPQELRPNAPLLHLSTFMAGGA